MNRFFIPAAWIGEHGVLLKGEQAHQIFHVLRLRANDHITVLDNAGWEYEVEIERAGEDLVEGKVVNRIQCATEPRLKITLYQALLKADKFELVLQKGVELGISVFVPFISERCVVKRPGEGKLTRWHKIIREAAEQSERGLLPVLHPVTTFKEACDKAEKTSLLLWEEEKDRSLHSVLASTPFRKAQSIGIFIGPEGGFPSEEVQYAVAKGITIASLGPRVLRAETAALSAISAVLYEMGEMG